MNTITKLSLMRTYQLMRNDILINKKYILMCCATIAVLLFLLPGNTIEKTNNYFFVLYLLGFANIARSFNEQHDTSKSYFYRMLPVNNIERFLAKWLLTSLIFAMALLTHILYLEYLVRH